MPNKPELLKLTPGQVDEILDKFTFSDKPKTNTKIKNEIKREIYLLEYMPFLLAEIKTWVNYIVFSIEERNIMAEEKWKKYFPKKKK